MCLKLVNLRAAFHIAASLACLLAVGGCATEAMMAFFEGQAAHQRGDYPTAVKRLEQALKVEPDSTIIKSTLSQVKTAWALETLKDFDKIPPSDLNQRLQRVKKAAEMAPEDPSVQETLKQTQALTDDVRARAAKVIALADDGNYAGAQAILGEIQKYNLPEVEHCGMLLRNSVDAHDKATKSEVKQVTLFTTFVELSKTQKVEPLGRAVKALVAEKVKSAGAQLLQQLVAKVDADEKAGNSKLPAKLAKLYKDALLESSREFPPIETASGRISTDPVTVGIYTKVRGSLHSADLLKGIKSGTALSFLSLSSRPLKEDLDKLGFILALGESREEIVETGRDNPLRKSSEYISSHQTVENPQYNSALRDLQAAQARHNELQGKLDTIGRMIVFGAAASEAKQKYEQAARFLQSTPQYIQEAVKTPYQYQEYNISLKARFEFSYHLIDLKRRLIHSPQKFLLEKEDRWHELHNVHPQDAAGLQNSRRSAEFRDNFLADFRQEAHVGLSRTLLDKIFAALRHRFKDSTDMGNMSEALEEAIAYAAVSHNLNNQPEKEITDFIAANLLKERLPVGDQDKIAGRRLDLSTILIQQYDKKALSLQDIEDLLRNHVSSKRVADFIRERGIRFEVTDQAKSRLRKSGADAELIKTLEGLSSSGESRPQAAR